MRKSNETMRQLDVETIENAEMWKWKDQILRSGMYRFFRQPESKITILTKQ